MAKSPALGRKLNEILSDRREYGAAERLFDETTTPRADGLQPPETNVITDWEYPASTRVQAYRYDHGRQTLQVRFVKYGSAYEYHGVPTAVFASFASAPSKGKFINSTLNGFPYEHVAGNLWTD